MDNRSKVVFGHLNINSIRNKFELLSENVKGNGDVLMISKTKVDDCKHMKSFWENCGLKNLIKQSTSYKNPRNPTYIDLILSKYMCYRNRAV